MTTSERIAVAWTPLFLRLALAATFLWAGSIKVLREMDLSPAQAATLRAMGLAVPDASAAPAPGASPAPAAPAPTLDKPLPVPDGPAAEPPAATKPRGPAMRDTSGLVARTRPMVETGPPVVIGPDPTQTLPAAARTTRPVALRQAAPDTPATAAPVRVRRLYGVALLIDSAAKPPADPGRKAVALWPGLLASGNRPLIAAWSVAVVELLAGLLVLIGLFTRLSALSLAGVMAGALWLTQIGPAIQSGQARLGFLPAHDAADTAAWSTPLWQFSLLMSALALLCAGAGAASIDRTLGTPAKPAPSGPAKA